MAFIEGNGISLLVQAQRELPDGTTKPCWVAMKSGKLSAVVITEKPKLDPGFTQRPEDQGRKFSPGQVFGFYAADFFKLGLKEYPDLLHPNTPVSKETVPHRVVRGNIVLS